jgi:bifunctional ADP-heptose synthase (sugar kinase/adenylyltransferase)
MNYNELAAGIREHMTLCQANNIVMQFDDYIELIKSLPPFVFIGKDQYNNERFMGKLFVYSWGGVVVWFNCESCGTTDEPIIGLFRQPICQHCGAPVV